MLRGNAADDLVGYPHRHSDCFQAVATMWDCIIMSRAVGAVCTGLIEEGYASKGFHVKAKSCNWGPTAGFIVEDPRFSKKGQAGIKDNRAANLDTLLSYPGATAVPILISEDRVRWLVAHNKMTVKSRTPSRMEVWATPDEAQPFAMNFVLVKERLPTAPRDLWGVHYRGDEHPDLLVGEERHAGLVPVRAMTDPLNAVATGYKRAQTGDYDLFAILPREEGKSGHLGYEHSALDMRSADLGGSRGEDMHVGNITARVWIIRDNLNEAIRHAGYTGGDMIQHSDEGGRPGDPPLEPPFIGWWPKAHAAYGMGSIQDLKAFMHAAHDEGFHIDLNTSWVRDLGSWGSVPAWNIDWDLRRKMTPNTSDARLPHPVHHH